MALDDAIYPAIVANNSQFRRRFALSNAQAVRGMLRQGDLVFGSYPQINDNKYLLKKRNLTLLHDLVSLPIRSAEYLYHEKIKEKEQMLDMVFHAGMVVNHASEASYEQFKQLTETLFGVPDLNLFLPIKALIKQRLLADDLSNLSNDERSILQAVFLTPSIMSDDVSSTLGASIVEHDSRIIVSAAEVKALFVQWLAQCGLSHWNISIRRTARGFSINTSKQLIFVPSDSFLRSRKYDRALTLKKLEAIFAHEVLTHVVRFESGKNSPLKLLGVGLPQYLCAEEGIASYREHAVMNLIELAGLRSYLVISLAYGLDRGGLMRGFHEVYMIMVAVLKLLYHCDDAYARMKAFTLCSRSIIIADFEKPLVVTHDLVYRDGHYKINQLLANVPIDDAVLNYGKYDPANKTHVELLVDLNLLSAQHPLVQYSE